MKRIFYYIILTLFAATPLYPQAVTPVRLTAHRGFNTPVGIDHHQPTNKVVLSVNYPTGQPHNFELVDIFGNRQPFSNISGLTEEVKIATARDDGGGKSLGGFTPGELFTGTGVPGHIARISADGATIQNPWVTLPGETGLLRGSLHIDRTGVFGGDLIVVTTEPTGNVWRVASGGVATKLASLGTHLEGVTTVPDNPAKYGPWAGKILAGAEQQNRIYTIDLSGNVAFFLLGIDPEDFDLIPANENFFGVDFGAGTLWTAPAAEFADKIGDVLITQEFPANLYHVRWTGAQFQVTLVAQATQWEHITFSTSPLDTCEVTIISPADSALVCSDRVKVTAKLRISGGQPPFTTQCDINGIAATVVDSLFSATVPCSPGTNVIVATCKVTDNEQRVFTCRDTIRVSVLIDATPPVCTIERGYKSVTGTISDLASGIAKIEPLFLFNAKLTIDPFVPGAKTVNYRLDDLGEADYLGFDIKITDVCGNTHVCDPVLFQLEADRKHQPFEVTFRSVDRYLMLANRGLSKIRVRLNGNQFSLLAQPDGATQDLNSYHIPADGEVTIDLQKYLQPGDNQIRFEFDGPSGARAEVMLIDEAHQIDHALELLPVPAEYQLSQNYPNPFGGAAASRLLGNPATTIRFSIPARVVEGTRVQLRIYNALGELLRVLVNEKMLPGNYAVTWDGQNRSGAKVASGIYIYQLVTGEVKQTKRMVVLR
jgi:hypothetical protein